MTGRSLRRLLGVGLVIEGILKLAFAGGYLRLWRAFLATTPFRRIVAWLAARPSRLLRLMGGIEVGLGLIALAKAPVGPGELYHVIAPVYDPLSRIWRTWLTADVHVAFDEALSKYLLPSGHVLDLGCGTGANLDQLRALGLAFDSYTGVDLSPDMLAVAQRKFNGLPNVRFQQLNLITDPLPEGPFDVVVSTWVFSHLPDPGPVVAKALGRLRPGGHAIFLFLADPRSWVSPLEDLLLRPFSARAVPVEVYRRFPHVTRVETFAQGTLAMAILTAPETGAHQSAAGHATREPSANEASP